MKLHILGSSSKGNCYLLKGNSTTLMLECGLRFSTIKKTLDFNLKGIAGCLVTHEHKDHSKSLNELLVNGIQVYCSKGTAGELRHHNLNIIAAKQQFEIGEFRILTFDTIHDVAEPLGFLIEQKSTGERLLFATDTYYIKYKFKSLNYLLIECNHSEKILADNVEKGKLHPGLKSRIEKSHLSLENLIDFMNSNDLSNVKKIILLHLSESNSNAEQFKDEIYKITNKETIIAEPGLEVDLELYPF